MGFENSGRRPYRQPTAVKLLRGNPSRSSINKREPLPSADVPIVKPALSAGAAAVWDVMAPICLAMRTLTGADVGTFATFCELQATFDQVIVEKSKPEYRPILWSEDSTGEPLAKIHPVVRLERDTAASLKAYYSFFGLEPSGRSRIIVPQGAEAPASKWA